MTARRPTRLTARLARRHGDLEAAEALYHRGATGSPPCPRAAYLLGALLHHSLDRPDEAEPWYRLAATHPAADPATVAAPAHIGLGLLLSDAALDADAAAPDPDPILAGGAVAAVEARDCFDRAAELAPADPAPHFFRGSLLEERGELRPAHAAYFRAVRGPLMERRHSNAGLAVERR
jgi:Flp pilus assembly protein TadD